METVNGWATQLAFWREAAPLGSQDGDAYRPPGIVDVAFRPDVFGRYERRDPLRATSSDTVLQQGWRISMKREPKVSGFESFWVDSVTDGIQTATTDGPYNVITRARVDNLTVPTFGLEFLLQDGNRRRFTGCALTRLEWLFESGRLIAEEAEFIALQGAEFVGDVRAATVLSLPALSALEARHYFRPGTTWTGGDAANNRVRTISAQIIFERPMECAQFDETGKATRHAISGGWDMVGRTRIIAPTYWGALHQTTRCKARFELGSGAFHRINADIEAKLSGSSVLTGGEVDTLIDFRAIRPTGGRALFEWANYQPI